MAFLTVDLAFHVQWDICQVQRQKPYCSEFAWLGNHASLANRKGGLCTKGSCLKYTSQLPLVFPKGFRLVLGKIWLSHCLAFHGQWNIFPVRCQKPYNCGFAHIGKHPTLPIRKGSTVEVVVASCQFCFSKLCLLFSPLGPRSPQQMQRPNYQMPSSKLVLNGDCVVQKSEVAKL